MSSDTDKNNRDGHPDWTHTLAEIPDDGLNVLQTAGQSELDAVAHALSLESCGALSADYTVKPAASGTYVLNGRLCAEITQSCIVSLEPVTSKLDKKLAHRFAPNPDITGVGNADDQQVLAPDAPELIENDTLDVGRLIFEVLSAAIDPYPRKQNAVFNPQSTQAKGNDNGRQSGAFSALTGWKHDKKES